MICPCHHGPILIVFAGFKFRQWRDLRATCCHDNRTDDLEQSVLRLRGDTPPASLGYIPSKLCHDIHLCRLHHFTPCRRVQVAQRCQVLHFVPPLSAWTMFANSLLTCPDPSRRLLVHALRGCGENLGLPMWIRALKRWGDLCHELLDWDLSIKSAAPPTFEEQPYAY